MSFAQSALLSGEVVHKRVHQFRHRLEYRTFSLLLDLDRIEDVERQCRLFSHNRWNVLSLFSSDHADGKHNDLAQYARELVAKELANTQVGKVYLMTYPRVFGYVFNPLSVYFCHDSNDECVAAIFEVNNTFGGRTSYVQRIEGSHIDPAQKQMLVSPFNGTGGRYSFRLQRTDRTLTVGVALREGDRPILNTWYRAKDVAFSDWQIAKLSFTRPLMTLKVMVAIHLEAAKLWFKGRGFRKSRLAA